jgi:predicted O-methyltransferase YrrM
VTRRTNYLPEELYSYLLAVSLREPTLLRRLREETASLESANMQVGPEQGQFMSLLVELMEARNALEIGTFTGYSALAIALALPEDGRLVACDVNEEWAAIARRYWEEAGVAHKIDLRLAPAEDTLDALLAEGLRGTFDFTFIDADKASYNLYYERALELTRSGGLLVLDNTLWEGKVVDRTATDADTVAIRAINTKLAHDQRVTLSLLPLGDGVTLARKREVSGADHP